MKKAIIEFLSRDEELKKRNQDADTALEEYQQTGQYSGHKDMETWLKTWGTDKEGPCPELKDLPPSASSD